ncbi:hypothetical protein DL770_001901 [Monosporascus sp. CRB-9-2]|nr:hypothetical protein DL770_001901 [Monosporascus sp. CRB-9-2]
MDLIWTALCAFLLLVAVLYDWVTKRIPSRLRPEQAPRTRFGLDPADGFSSPGDVHGADIIFVHGLGSNPDTTWGARKLQQTAMGPAQTIPDGVTRRCWVEDFLPEDIPESQRQHVRVFFYNYDTSWKRDAVQTRLQNIRNDLLTRLLGIRTTKEERRRKLVFVGHSYGGLVIKSALIRAHKHASCSNIAEHTRAVFFLGTPHRGSTFSALGSVIARALQPLGSNPSILHEVAYDSLSLLDMQDDFIYAITDELQVVNFFELRKTRLLKVWFLQWEEFSARYPGGKVQNHGLSVDHYGLNKFEVRNENYKLVAGKLLEILSPLTSQRRALYSVPIETDKNYSDRHELSRMLEEKLHKNQEKSGVPHAVVIHGPHDAGKTELALKYAEVHRDDYNPVLWVDASDEESMRSSFERFVDQLPLHIDRPGSQTTKLVDSLAVKAVLCWLRGRKDDEWLVILDHADDITKNMQMMFPRGLRGNIIVTSQDSRAGTRVNGGCEKLQIGMMEPLEASSLLLRHLGWELDSAPQDVLNDCNEVAKELGYLPSLVNGAGLDIADACIVDKDQKAALRQYLVDYRAHRDDPLHGGHFCGLTPSDKTMWTAWDTTLERIQHRHAKHQPDLFLGFLSRVLGRVIQEELFSLASLGIHLVNKELFNEDTWLPDWLAQLLTTNGQKWDSFYYRQSRDILARYNLMQRVDGEWPGVVLRGLVRWRAKYIQSLSPLFRWYIGFMTAAGAELEKQGLPQSRRHFVTQTPDLRPEHWKGSAAASEWMLFVWTTFSRIYHNEGGWKEAEGLFAQLVETRKRVLGTEHPDTPISINNLASTQGNQGRWKEAKELGVRVMETMKKVLGKEHPDTQTSLGSLALTYAMQGRHSEVCNLLAKATVSETFDSIAARWMGTGKGKDVFVRVTQSDLREPLVWLMGSDLGRDLVQLLAPDFGRDLLQPLRSDLDPSAQRTDTEVDLSLLQEDLD